MLLRKVISIASTAFLFNFVWEMLQMPFYLGMIPTDLNDWYLCFKAALGDLAVTLSIYIAGRTGFREWSWPFEFNVPQITYIALVGAAFATYFEITALESGEWGYPKLMPRVPLLNVGVVPRIQMMVLPALSCKVGLRISQRFNRKA